jgi:hypothetical protein
MIEIIEHNELIIQKLDKLIEEIKIPNPPKSLKILTMDAFLERPVPKYDIPQSNSAAMYFASDEKHRDTLSKCTDILGHERNTNACMMFKGTQLPWHTNSNRPGIRIYYSKGGGAFKFLDEHGLQQISVDNENGWTVRQFELPKNRPFWHSVYATSNRFSFGFGSDA